MKHLQFAALFLIVGFHASVALAQSDPFIINGPGTALHGGCHLAPEELPPVPLTSDCVTISYDGGSMIAQNRYVLVPRGNLEFDFPVTSTIRKLSSGRLNVSFFIMVTVTGPNPGEVVSQQSSGMLLHDAGSGTLRVPVNVDWAESIVSFQIYVSEEQCFPGSKPNGEPNCSYAEQTFPGPDLSAVTNGANWIGAQWPTPLTNDAFIVVATPAAAFQLPIIPTTIVYGPVGNGPSAESSYSVTEITASNQQFSNSNEETHGVTSDDKTEYQGSVTLSAGVPERAGKVVCGTGASCKVSLGLNYMGSWDHSTENENQSSFGSSKSVSFETQNQYTVKIVPTTGQPPLDQITPDTQPFWADVILGVANAQYALWDYPAGPVIQPLGGASLIALPVRQLDHCVHTPNAIEPTGFTPSPWSASSSFAPGTVILDANSNIQITSAGGVSGAVEPTWNTVDGASTTDGSVTWTNVQSQFGIYRGTVVGDSAQYIRIGPWEPNQNYPAGSVVLGPASIEVATTAGVSGGVIPNWNTADGSTTIDGSVTWTNEQEHFVVAAAAPALRQSTYQWLTPENCADYLSLDQFYVSQSQSATPVAYDVLGSMLSVVPANATTYSNSNKTTSTVGESSSGKHTTQVTSIVTNSLGVSGSIDFGLALTQAILGINLSGSDTHTWSTTTSNSTVDSATLESTRTVSGETMASTTIQDTGSEQSIPVNVLQDAIFMGVAVQDTNLPVNPPAAQTKAALSEKEVISRKFPGLPTVPVGHSAAMLRVNGAAEPSEYVQQTNYGFAMVVKKPASTPGIQERVRAIHARGAQTHTARPIPAALLPSVRQ